MTDAEIAGYMGWRGPGAYSASAMRKIKRVIADVESNEREACAKVCEELRGLATKDNGDDAAQDFADSIRERLTQN